MKLLSRGLVVSSALVLAGCNVFSDGQEYKSAQRTRPLEVPPTWLAQERTIVSRCHPLVSLAALNSSAAELSRKLPHLHRTCCPRSRA